MKEISGHMANSSKEEEEEEEEEEETWQSFLLFFFYFFVCTKIGTQWNSSRSNNNGGLA
mgnify:CR=1 FL=1